MKKLRQISGKIVAKFGYQKISVCAGFDKIVNLIDPTWPIPITLVSKPAHAKLAHSAISRLKIAGPMNNRLSVDKVDWNVNQTQIYM